MSLTHKPRLELVPPDESGGAAASHGRSLSGGPLAVVVLALFGIGAVAASSLSSGLYAPTVWQPVALGVLALAVAVVVSVPFEADRRTALAIGALVALTAWAALSMTWAPSVDRAWTEVNRLALYTAVLGVAAVCTRSDRTGVVLVGGFAIAISALGTYALLRMVLGNGEELFLDYRFDEPLSYANGQAGMLLMGVVVLLGFAERGSTLGVRAASAGGMTMLACLAVLTQSRAIVPAIVITFAVLLAGFGGRVRRALLLSTVAVAVAIAIPVLLDVFAERDGLASGFPSDGALRAAALATLAVSALAAGAWWLLSGWVARAAGRRARTGIAVVLVLVPVLLAGAAIAITDDPVGKLESRIDDFTALQSDQGEITQRFTFAGGYRYDLWRIAVKEFRSAPIKGVGAGGYVAQYLPERRTPEHVRQPHSIELQMLAELGLVGFGFLALMVIAVIAAAVRPGPRAAVQSSAIRLGAAGVFIAWLAHTSVDWLYNLPGLSIVAFACAGLLVGRVPEPAPASSPRTRRVVAVAAVVIVAIAAASIGRQLGASVYRTQAESELSAAPADALTSIRRSLTLNATDVNAYYVLAAVQARADRYDDARAALLEAADRERFNYVPWALLGDLATRRGDAVQAGRDYARARALNPRDAALTAPAEDSP